MIDLLAAPASSDGTSAAVVAAWIAAGVSLMVALFNAGYDSYQRKKDRGENARALLDLGLREDMAVANSLDVGIHTWSAGDHVSRTIYVMNLSDEPFLDVSVECEDSNHVIQKYSFSDDGKLDVVEDGIRKIGILQPKLMLHSHVFGAERAQDIRPIVRFMLPSGRRFVHRGPRSIPEASIVRGRNRWFFRRRKTN